MTEVNMTIHEALREIKMLDKRIAAFISEAPYMVTVTMASDDKIGSMTIADWEKETRAAYQSGMDLIVRRNALKQAINLSNAQTLIKIDALGTEISVAAAIELQKTGVFAYKKIADGLRLGYKNAIHKETNTNERATSDATDFAVKVSASKDAAANTKVTPAQVEEIRKTYYDTHKAIIRNPIDAEKNAKALEELAERISAEVDSKLSVSNATTVLNFSYRNYGEK